MTRHEVEIQAVTVAPDGAVTALWAREAIDDAPAPIERDLEFLVPLPAKKPPRPLALPAQARQRRVVQGQAAAWLALVTVAAVAVYALTEALA